MPIYEFECGNCKNKFEKLCRISSDTDGVSCPECEDNNVKRLISGFFSHTTGSSGSSGHSCNCGGSCGRSSCSGCGCH